MSGGSRNRPPGPPPAPTVLGHPSRPGSRVGRLHRPAALTQHRRDDSRSAGALVIADAGNDRVQRRNTYGYTHWSRKVRIPKD